MTVTDSFNWRQPVDRLAPVVAAAREKLGALDRAELAQRSGATLDPQGNLHLAFLRHEYVIDQVEWIVKRVGDGIAPSPLVQSLILTYLQSADGTPPNDRWLGFRELPNGLFYAQAFQSYTGAVLIREIKGNVAAFKQASEKLSATALTIGDASYAFQVFPRVKLAVVMWQGDEEFPAQAQVLFEETASHYLITDGLAIVGGLLIKQVISATG